MRFRDAASEYIANAWSTGRIRSPRTEAHYHTILMWHGEDCAWRDPCLTTREDVKKTLLRWPNPNSYRTRRSIMISFYEYLVEEGYRPANPARQTRSVRRAPTSVYRMTAEEVLAFLAACDTPRERRVAYLGTCAGLRLQELRGLTGRHFAREGWVHVDSAIAKGARERWVPVTRDLAGVVDEIRRNVGADEHVLHSIRTVILNGTQKHRATREDTSSPASPQAIGRIVEALGKRAGIEAKIHPHLMRHAFADHVARYKGMQVAQALLGHADIGTTQGYLDAPSLDELRVSMEGFSFIDPEGGHVSEEPQTQSYRHGDSNPGSTHFAN